MVPQHIRYVVPSIVEAQHRVMQDTVLEYIAALAMVCNVVVGSWVRDLKQWIRMFADFAALRLGTSVEEMEGAAAAMMAEAFGVPMLAIRVLSNNITNGGVYDPSTAQDCQEYTLRVVRHFISTFED